VLSYLKDLPPKKKKKALDKFDDIKK